MGRPPSRLRTLILVAAVLASVVVLFGPSSDGEPGVAHADKVVHAVLFAALTAAGLWRFPRVAAVAAAASAYALASEVVQGALPARQADPRDLAADLAGVLVVAAVSGLRARAGAG